MNREEKIAYRKTLKPGDQVFVGVDEQECPWIRGSWKGTVMSVGVLSDINVKPDSWNYDWVIKPSPSYFEHGLYLTLLDNVGEEVV